MMLLTAADKVALWSLWVAVIAAVAAIIGAVAAIYAAVYAKEAPTKEDLARVEDNTAHLEEVKANIVRMDERMHRQGERDAAISEAQKVAIAVSGENDLVTPLQVYLRLKDHTVEPTSAELFNENGTLFGSCETRKIEELLFLVSIDPDIAKRWFAGGTGTGSFDRVRLRLRVNMVLSGQRVYREFAVTLTDVSRQEHIAVVNTINVVHSYFIQGNV